MYVQVKKYGPNIFGIPENWPIKIKRVSDNVLESDYDYVISEVDYDAFIAANKASYDAGKAAIQTQADASTRANKFKRIREKWQSMADIFAADNVASGITNVQATQLANAFDLIEKYLRLNVPMKAISEISTMTPIPPFLTAERRDAMKNELLAFIQNEFSS